MHRARRSVKARSCTCPASRAQELYWWRTSPVVSRRDHKMRIPPVLVVSRCIASVHIGAVRRRSAAPSLAHGFCPLTTEALTASTRSQRSIWTLQRSHELFALQRPENSTHKASVSSTSPVLSCSLQLHCSQKPHKCRASASNPRRATGPTKHQHQCDSCC